MSLLAKLLPGHVVGSVFFTLAPVDGALLCQIVYGGRMFIEKADLLHL